MLDRRSVRLAPLYDLLSYAAYWDGSARIESAMSIGGEYSLARISPAGLERTGALFGIGQEAAAEIVRVTRAGIYSAFESARPSVEVHGRSARAVADDLLRGLRALPLVEA